MATSFSGDNTSNLDTIAAQHGFSSEAAQAVWQALAAGGGTMAQFRHPELGGTGQWTQGGLIMIGDMFNHALKARVEGLCSALSHLLQGQQRQSPHPPVTSRTENPADQWWGADLGTTAASGSQNNLRYAYFPATRRLAVLQHNRVTIYDTGSHHITGVAQQPSSTGFLTFRSQHGSVRLTDFSVVSESSMDSPSSAVPEPSAKPVDHQPTSAAGSHEQVPGVPPGRERSDEIFYQLERLAELRDKDVLSEAEFISKKAELLTRL